MHPGVIFTELQRNAVLALGWIKYIILYLKFRPLAKTIEQGAATTLYCAVADELKGVSGKYFTDCKETPLQVHALNDEDAKRLWSLSEKLVTSKIKVYF